VTALSAERIVRFNSGVFQNDSKAKQQRWHKLFGFLCVA
jgi:hypothetical protein